MRRRVLLALALWMLAPPGAVLARAEEDPELASRLDAVLRGRALRGARTGALVVARDDGRVLYARGSQRPLVPASNQKILTAIAALDAFGPTHRFQTRIYASAPPDAEGAVDALMIRGGGDPSLTSEDAWRLAADLRRLGLRRVRGGLRIDDSAFDTERWHPSWAPISARAYHAPVGALSMNYGAFATSVLPGPRDGAPVQVFLDPPAAFLQLSNRAVTGPPRARRRLVVERKPGAAGELVTVAGRIPVESEPVTVHRSVLDPARYAASVIRLQLEAVGIRVEGETRLGAVPESAVLLHEFEGKSLAEIVRLFVKYSNNAIAESLVKALGARASGGAGSWSNGVVAMRKQLDALGLETAGLKIVDGSGLSYDNRVTARSLVDALRLTDRSFRFGPELVAALPIAGGDGTLQERAEEAGAAIRAKTGLLTRVTGLSGYARLPDGTEAVFSLLANGYRTDARRAMNAVDAFVTTLVQSPTAQR